MSQLVAEHGGELRLAVETLQKRGIDEDRAVRQSKGVGLGTLERAHPHRTGRARRLGCQQPLGDSLQISVQLRVLVGATTTYQALLERVGRCLELLALRSVRRAGDRRDAPTRPQRHDCGQSRKPAATFHDFRTPCMGLEPLFLVRTLHSTF